MSKIYDTGDIELTYTAGAVIAENKMSELEEVTINDYGAKIIKVIIEVTDAAAVTGTVYIFSETNGSWDVDTDDATGQAPMWTTGHIASIACDAVGEIDDTARYFMNNDSTVAKKLYLAYGNQNADTCKVKVRILYESLALGT